jgi:hypothetical protein
VILLHCYYYNCYIEKIVLGSDNKLALISIPSLIALFPTPNTALTIHTLNILAASAVTHS